MKKLDITQEKSRTLVKKICEDFELPTCQVFFIDVTSLDNMTLALYVESDFSSNGVPAYMLIEKRWSRRLVLVLHEVIHHLQNIKYDGMGHGYKFGLARGRIVTWAKHNISDNFDWCDLFKAQTKGRMKCKKKKKKK